MRQDLRLDLREVSRGFLVLCLFFSEMSCEGDDVGVDAFGAGACVVAVAVSVGGHDEDEGIAGSELVNVEVEEV